MGQIRAWMRDPHPSSSQVRLLGVLSQPQLPPSSNPESSFLLPLPHPHSVPLSVSVFPGLSLCPTLNQSLSGSLALSVSRYFIGIPSVPVHVPISVPLSFSLWITLPISLHPHPPTLPPAAAPFLIACFVAGLLLRDIWVIVPWGCNPGSQALLTTEVAPPWNGYPSCPLSRLGLQEGLRSIAPPSMALPGSALTQSPVSM